MVVMTSHLFTCMRHSLTTELGLDRLYVNLANVTVARGDDLLATHYAARHRIVPTTSSSSSPSSSLNSSSALPYRGFDSLVNVVRTTNQYTFSIGLGAHTKHVPLAIATWHKFQNATNFIFYHTRTTPSICNSTEYRMAPIHNVSWSQLPNSSIGFDLPRMEWQQQLLDSQFCLVIRGDTPHSHSLFAAVKAGCIPVIISDWYLFYAPPFPATLNLWDFAIFISEDEFLTHPHESLTNLLVLPERVLQDKVRALAWAQQVMLLDHPQSLFVPAFLREAMASFTRPRSKLVSPSDVDQMWCPDTCAKKIRLVLQRWR